MRAGSLEWHDGFEVAAKAAGLDRDAQLETLSGYAELWVLGGDQVMKKTATGILVFFALVYASYSQERRIIITADKANIYLEPNTSSPVIETLMMGSVLKVSVYGEGSGWFAVLIMADGREPAKAGYIQASLVQYTNEKTRILRKGRKGQTAENMTAPGTTGTAKVLEEKPTKIAETKKVETAEKEPEKQKPEEKTSPVKTAAPKPVSQEKEAAAAKEKAAQAPVPKKREEEKPAKVETAEVKKEPEKQKPDEKAGSAKTVMPKPVSQEKGSVAAKEKATQAPVPKKREEEKPAHVAEGANAAQALQTRPAPAHLRRFALGVSAGLASTSNYGKGVDFGGILDVNISRMIGIDLRSHAYKGSINGEGLRAGTMTTNSIQLGLKFRALPERVFSPFLAAGGAYFINDFALSGETVAYWESLGFSISESIENSFGYFVGGGLDIRLLPWALLTLDGRYCPVSNKGRWELVETGTGVRSGGTLEGPEINPFFIGMGILISF